MRQCSERWMLKLAVYRHSLHAAQEFDRWHPFTVHELALLSRFLFQDASSRGRSQQTGDVGGAPASECGSGVRLCCSFPFPSSNPLHTTFAIQCLWCLLQSEARGGESLYSLPTCRIELASSARSCDMHRRLVHRSRHDKFKPIQAPSVQSLHSMRSTTRFTA